MLLGFLILFLLVFIRLALPPVWHTTTLPVWQESSILLRLKYLRRNYLPIALLRIRLVNINNGDHEIQGVLNPLVLFVFHIEFATGYNINGNYCPILCIY